MMNERSQPAFVVLFFLFLLIVLRRWSVEAVCAEKQTTWRSGENRRRKECLNRTTISFVSYHSLSLSSTSLTRSFVHKYTSPFVFLNLRHRSNNSLQRILRQDLKPSLLRHLETNARRKKESVSSSERRRGVRRRSELTCAS